MMSWWESSETPLGCGGISVGAQLPVTVTLECCEGLGLATVTPSPAGARGLLCLGHCCDGRHQLTDVDVL